MRARIFGLVGLALAFVASAASAEIAVTSCSRTEPSGERTLCQEAVIDAPAHDVWTLFTTSDGLRSWAAPIAAIDARVGGQMETSYNPQAHIGDAGNIRNRIVAAVPDASLIMQVANTPPGFAHAEEVRQVSTVIELTPIDAAHTRLRISMIGYREGAGFDAVYRFFEWGNSYSLQKLAQRVSDGPIDWSVERAGQNASPETR